MTGLRVGRPSSPELGLKRPGMAFVLVAALLGVATVALCFMDDATIVSPSVDDARGDLAALSLLAGLAVIPFMAWAVRGAGVWTRICLGAVSGLVTSAILALGSTALVDVVEDARLFPRSRSRPRSCRFLS